MSAIVILLAIFSMWWRLSIQVSNQSNEYIKQYGDLLRQFSNLSNNMSAMATKEEIKGLDNRIIQLGKDIKGVDDRITRLESQMNQQFLEIRTNLTNLAQGYIDHLRYYHGVQIPTGPQENS